MVRKNWNQIDRMALDSALFLLNYCDSKEICADCIFHDESIRKCSIHIGSFSQGEKFLEEVKRDV